MAKWLQALLVALGASLATGGPAAAATLTPLVTSGVPVALATTPSAVAWGAFATEAPGGLVLTLAEGPARRELFRTRSSVAYDFALTQGTAGGSVVAARCRFTTSTGSDLLHVHREPLARGSVPPSRCDLVARGYDGGPEVPLTAVSRPDASEYHPAVNERWLAYVRATGRPTDRERAASELRVRDLRTGRDVRLPSGPRGEVAERPPVVIDQRRPAGLGPVELGLDGDVLAVRWHWLRRGRSWQAILRYDLRTRRMREVTRVSERIGPPSMGEYAPERHDQLGGPAVSGGQVLWTRWGRHPHRLYRNAGGRTTSTALPAGPSGAVAVDVAATRTARYVVLEDAFDAWTPCGVEGRYDPPSGVPVCGVSRVDP